MGWVWVFRGFGFSYSYPTHTHTLEKTHGFTQPMPISTQGYKTVWYQPPDDNSNINPELLKESAPSAAGHSTHQQEQFFGNNASGFVNADAPGPELVSQAVNIEKSNTPGSQHGPKPSMASCDAIENACKAILKLLQKHSLVDTLMEIQR